MALINAGSFLPLLTSYRMLWIGGRYGGGKTSFAIKLSEEYLKRGYRLFTNIGCVWADEEIKLNDEGKLKAIIIIDEAGMFLKVRQQVEAVVAYAAKMDAIYMFPSFFPPPRAAQVLTVQPLFNFLSTGIPIIVYKWRVSLGGFKDSGLFFWSNPKEIYGIYSRLDSAQGSYNLMDKIQEATEEYKGKSSKGYYKDDPRGANSSLFEISKDAIFGEAVEGLQDISDGLLTTIPKRKGRRW